MLAQNVDSVKNVYIIPGGATFTNYTDSVYFALPRYRVERLLRDAIMSDTIKSLYLHWIEQTEKENMKTYSTIKFWQGTALTAALITILTLIIRR